MMNNTERLLEAPIVRISENGTKLSYAKRGETISLEVKGVITDKVVAEISDEWFAHMNSFDEFMWDYLKKLK